MLKHIVFWNISSREDKAAHRSIQEEFVRRCAHLETVIPQFHDYRIALNSEAGGGNFDICIDSSFASKAALDAYIEHPEHLKVREWLNSQTCGKTVFDYEY